MSSPEDPPKKDPRDADSVSDLYGTSEKDSMFADEGDVYPDDYSSSKPVQAPAPPPPPPPAEPPLVSEPVASASPADDELPRPEPTPLAPDEPILPATSDENALREAVGIPVQNKRVTAKIAAQRDDGEPSAKSRKLLTVVAVSLLAIITIAVFAILGSVNSRNYAITCSADRITAEQGRSFPPWGTQPMSGAEWKSIELPPNAECTPRETESKAELEGWYLDVLLERASATLTQKDLLETAATPTGGGKPGPNVLDHVNAQLQQALLLSRSSERRDQRKEVERLLGDVQYWRASLRLRDASAALLDASKQFEAAAQQRPRHVTDAAAWGQYVKKLADDLRAGPNGKPAAQLYPPTPTGDRPSAPMGTALPVEAQTPPPEAETAPPPTPDAGVPTGGVLL